MKKTTIKYIFLCSVSL